jgi:hypothetical protein
MGKAILTTVINFDLYNKSNLLFPKEYDKYVIDGRYGMYGIESICYMMKCLKKKQIDWLVMADEDLLFVDANEVDALILEMEKNDIMVAGVRDGGVIAHRNHNPMCMNTFFNVINFKKLQEIWDEKEMLSNQVVYENEFESLDLPFDNDVNSLFEPYYCFYLWLHRKNQKMMFLPSVMNHDGISNIVLNNDGGKIVFHTWYARTYGKDVIQTNRIDERFSEIGIEYNNTTKPKLLVDYYRNYRNYKKKVVKILKKIKNRITKYLNG